MKQFLALCSMGVLVAFQAIANQDDHNVQYNIRVDGMACPYCAYGIEKKIKEIDGVKNINVDLANGIVSVCIDHDTVLTAERMTALFRDAGFTYRGMERAEQCQPL